jgi:hypothetical protein
MTVIAQQKPDFSGDWTLNRQASTLSRELARAHHPHDLLDTLRRAIDCDERRDGPLALDQRTLLPVRLDARDCDAAPEVFRDGGDEPGDPLAADDWQPRGAHQSSAIGR